MSRRKLPGSPAGIAPRHFCIYREVVIERLTQEVVAERYKVTQGRVSQIVARVQRALDEAQPEDDSALVAAREARREARECRERREHYLTLAAEGYRQSSQPLVTVKTRTRGEEEEFQEKIERPQKANVQFLKLMVKLNGELEEGSGFGVQGSGGKTEERKPVTIANSRPTPTAGELAVRQLASVRTGSGSLAEVETWNFVNQLSDGYDYPSYFEKSAESINGVRVADWVREHVADELLPHGDEVWLPVEHNLKDFDGTDRELVQDDTSQRFFNPNHPAYHFGPKLVREGEGSGFGVQGSGTDRGQEPGSRGHEKPQETSHFATPVAACVTRREGAGETERRESEGETERRESDKGPRHQSPQLPPTPTWAERTLASGRTMPPSQRRRLERVVARRAAALQEGSR